MQLFDVLPARALDMCELKDDLAGVHPRLVALRYAWSVQGHPGFHEPIGAWLVREVLPYGSEPHFQFRIVEAVLRLKACVERPERVLLVEGTFRLYRHRETQLSQYASHQWAHNSAEQFNGFAEGARGNFRSAVF